MNLDQLRNYVDEIEATSLAALIDQASAPVQRGTYERVLTARN